MNCAWIRPSARTIPNVPRYSSGLATRRISADSLSHFGGCDGPPLISNAYSSRLDAIARSVADSLSLNGLKPPGQDANMAISEESRYAARGLGRRRHQAGHRGYEAGHRG